LNNQIKYWLMDNWMKCEYEYQKSTFTDKDYLIKTTNSFWDLTIWGRKALYTLFYSEKETLVFNKKRFFDTITNKWEVWEFFNNADNRSFKFKNLSNFIWRTIAIEPLKLSLKLYSSQYKKEDEIHTKREELIKKIEENLK
jgi:hypothetical protein